MAWANGHSERTCRAARPGACGFACAAGREVPGCFAHCCLAVTMDTLASYFILTEVGVERCTI